MHTIAELIAYHPESTSLDFKQEQYKDANKFQLIKDVQSFANAQYSGERRIIIGVKKKLHGFELFDIKEPEDSASIQQYILANITPDLMVHYLPYIHEGKNLMILTIDEPLSPPYLIKKNIQIGNKVVLREGEIWIRKGSHQMPANRNDLDAMYAKKQASKGLEGMIAVTFENGKQILEVPCVRDIQLPSDTEKAELERAIQKKAATPPDPSPFAARSVPKDVYEAMELPNLEYSLAHVKQHFKQEDLHYLYETRAFKLNLMIDNNGEENLAETRVEILLPETHGLKIADHIYTKGELQIISLRRPVAEYPHVCKNETTIQVVAETGNVRHRVPTPVFDIPLRMHASEEIAGQELALMVKVHGKNLKVPETFELRIRFV